MMSGLDKLSNKLGRHFRRQHLLEHPQALVLNLRDNNPDGISSDIRHSSLPLGVDDRPHDLGEEVLYDSSLIDLNTVAEVAEEGAEIVVVWHLEESKLPNLYQVLLDTLKPRVEGCGIQEILFFFGVLGMNLVLVTEPEAIELNKKSQHSVA